MSNPERLLISSILRGGDLAVALKAGLLTEMFHLHREEFAWMEHFHQKYKKCPSKSAFKAKFSEFVIERCDDTAHFADEVRKSHIRHEMLGVMSDAADLLGEGDVESAVRKMTSSIVQIAAKTGVTDDTDIFTDYETILGDVQQRVARVQEGGFAGIPYGMDTLDEKTGGASPGDLVIIGARLGVGKSWFMKAIACNAVFLGHTVQFDALEQSRAQVGMRVHALMSGKFGKQLFASSRLMQGKEFVLSEYMEFLKTLKAQMPGRLHVSDASRGQVSVATVAAQIERNQPEAVFIDYLTLMAKDGPDWQGVAKLSGDLKALATSYQIPIFAAAQLNREYGIGKRGEPPAAEALAQSDAIGQDADAVITMAKASPSVLKCRMAKNRNGAGDFTWHVQFQPDLGIIREVSANKAQLLIDKDNMDAEKNGEETY
jgi:replicative DNA helicase